MVCEICMPLEHRRNAAVNRLARKEAQSLPAGELLGRTDREPFSEEEILNEMNREDIEILKDCG